MAVSELAEACKYLMLHYYLRTEGYSLWEIVYFTTPSSAFSLAARGSSDTPLTHPSYTPHTPLIHPSYTPHTPLIHPS